MLCNGGNKSHYKHSPHLNSKRSLNLTGGLKLIQGCLICLSLQKLSNQFKFYLFCVSSPFPYFKVEIYSSLSQPQINLLLYS